MIDAVFHSHRILGQAVRYRVLGHGEKLLFLHGTWVDPFIFEKLIRGLAARYEILVPDIPPFGLSRSDRTLSLEQYSILFDELVEFLGWKHISVIGHSFGGGIALHMAAKSTHISRVVGCNPIGIPFQRPEILKKYPAMVYKAVVKLSRENDTSILKKIIVDVGQVLLKNPLKPIVQTITQCLCEDERILAQIPISVSIIWAKQDELLPISYIRRLHRLVPHIQVVYIEGHHNWCLVDQTSALRLILKRLS